LAEPPARRSRLADFVEIRGRQDALLLDLRFGIEDFRERDTEHLRRSSQRVREHGLATLYALDGRFGEMRIDNLPLVEISCAVNESATAESGTQAQLPEAFRVRCERSQSSHDRLARLRCVHPPARPQRYRLCVCEAPAFKSTDETEIH